VYIVRSTVGKKYLWQITLTLPETTNNHQLKGTSAGKESILSVPRNWYCGGANIPGRNGQRDLHSRLLEVKIWSQIKLPGTCHCQDTRKESGLGSKNDIRGLDMDIQRNDALLHCIRCNSGWIIIAIMATALHSTNGGPAHPSNASQVK